MIAATETSNRLSGKTVFVGYSDLNSPDQPDRFYTVFTSDKGIDLSGLEIMATSFANLMTDSTIKPLSPVEAALVVVLFGLVISQFVYWPAAYIAVPLALLASAGYIYGAMHLFAGDHLWIPLAVPIAIQLPFAIVAGLLGQYIVERREKQRVGAAIANYLPDHLVRELTTGRVDANSFDQGVHGICLANDMSGFSGIAEHKSPAELATFMNSYFEAVAAALKKCEVDVTEFHADTIMCAWLGKPDEVEFRTNAIRAALEVVRSIEEFSASDPEVTLNARVGLQDGPFYLGHTGGGGRMSYSILGNPANAASRLEGLNKKLGTKILASSSAVTGLDGFVTRPLGHFMVVGKSEMAEVVEIIGLKQEIDMSTQQLIDGFADALEAFLQEQWEMAGERFAELAARFPKDGASRFYLGICRRYLADGAPVDDPTVLAMTEK